MALQDHFDNTALRFLYDMMAEDFSLLVTLFCQDADERLPRLRQALHTGDCAAVASLAHSFKGAAANISAIRLTNMLQQLEDAGRAGHLGGTLVLLDAVEQEYCQVRDCLQALVNKTGPVFAEL